MNKHNKINQEHLNKEKTKRLESCFQMSEIEYQKRAKRDPQLVEVERFLTNTY